MTKKSPAAKRLLALILALVMALGSTVECFAATYDVTGKTGANSVKQGELVAVKYDSLTEGEKNILSSGYLGGTTVDYTVPTKDNVTVDPDKGTITAKSSDGWTAGDTATVDGTEVKLTDGKGTFTAVNNSFDVSVPYTKTVTVDVALQKQMMAAMYALLHDSKNMENLSAAKALLGDDINTAIDTMYDLVQNGRTVNFHGTTLTVKVADVAAEITALYNQKQAGGLELLNVVKAYDGAADKVQNLLDNLTAIAKVAADVKGQLEKIAESSDLRDIRDNIPRDSEDGKSCGELLDNLIGVKNSASRGQLGDAADKLSGLTWLAMNAEGTAAQDELLAAAKNDGLNALVQAAVTGKFEDRTALVTDADCTLSCTVNTGVARVEATVRVVVNVIEGTDSDTPTPITYTRTVKMLVPDAAGKDEVIALVKANADATALKDEAVASWASYGVNDTNFTCTESYSDGEALFSYEFMPKEFSYAIGSEAAVKVPYGYKLTLPKSTTEGLSYIYKTADGAAYLQGDVYTVKGDVTFTREEGKANVYMLSGLLNEQSGLTDSEKAVLSSGVLKINGSKLYVFAPDAKDAASLIKINNTTVTAQPYDSKYNNLKWTAKTAEVTKGDAVTETVSFVDNKATLASADFDSVKVTYELTIMDVTGAQTYVELPGVLKDEVSKHQNAMQTLVDAGLKALTKDVLSKIVKELETTSLSASALNAVKTICSDEYFDSNNQLKLYNYLSAYQQGGMAYLYQNGQYDIIKTEASKLTEQLKIFTGDPNYETALKQIDYGSYADTLTKAKDKIDGVIKRLPATSDKVFTFVDVDGVTKDALNQACALMLAVVTGTRAASAVALNMPLTVGNTNKVLITVKLITPTTTETKSLALMKDSTGKAAVTADTLTALESMKNQLWNAWTPAEKDTFYKLEGTIDLQAGDELTDNQELVFTVGLKEIEVKVGGTAVGNPTIDNPVIQLPVPTEDGVRFDYDVAGTKVSLKKGESGTYTLTAAQLLALAKGTASITYTEVNVAAESVKNLFQGANNRMNSQLLNFLVYGNDNVVMRLMLNGTNGIKAEAKAVAKAFGEYFITDSGIATISVDGKLLFKDSKFSLNAMTEIVLNSGVGTDAFLSAVNADGTVNNVTVAGTCVVSAAQGGNENGGQVMQLDDVTITFEDGTSAVVTLYVTVAASSTARMKQAREYIQKAVNKGNTAVCENGELVLNGNMPDRAWQAIVSGMLLTGKIDVSDVSALTLGDLVNYVRNDKRANIEELLNDDTLTLTTIQNTLDKAASAAGTRTADLSVFDRYFNYARKAAKLALTSDKVTWTENTNSGDTYGATLTADSEALVEKLVSAAGLPGAATAWFASETISFPFTATLADVNTEYEALVLDPTAAGAGKVRFTTDLSATLATAGDKTIVLLLNDVADDLSFTKQSYLVLNGKTVAGGISSAKSLTIMDSVLDSNGTGKVNGRLSGKIAVVGGTYVNDVSAFLSEGYAVNNGTVVNNYYTLTKTGDTVTIALKAAAVEADAKRPALRKLVMDAAARIGVNYATTSGLKVTYEGVDYDIFSISDIDNVAALRNLSRRDLAEELLSKVNYDGAKLETLANTVAKDLKFNVLADRVRGDEALVSFTMDTSAWDAKLFHESNGDYLTAGITTIGSKITDVKVVMEGTADEKSKTADLLDELSRVVYVDLDASGISGSTLQRNGSEAIFSSTGTIVATLDFTVNRNYPAVMAAVIAYGTTDAGLKAALVDGINTYLGASQNAAPLKTAMERITTKNVVDSLGAAYGKTIQEIFTELGVTGNTADAVTLENLYHTVLNIGYRVADWQTYVQGSNRALGGLAEGGWGNYHYVASNVRRSISRSVYVFDGTVNGTANVDLTVKLFSNDLTVIYDANGGVGSMANDTIRIGETKNLTANAYTKEGYHFVGWLGDDGNTYTDAQSVTADATGVLTLTAQWEINTYTVTFDLNGGQGTAPASQTVNHGEKATAPATPTRAGFNFTGWYNGTDLYDFNTAVTGDLTLKAGWAAKAQYTVKFDLNGGQGTAPADQTVLEGDKVTAPADPTRTGYTFDGWYVGASTGNPTKWNFATDTVTGNITLWAKWTANTFTVVFDKNDANATGTMANQTFTYGVSQNLTLNAFSKSGYHFNGWNTAADGSGTMYANGASVKDLAASGTVTLYAQWAQNSSGGGWSLSLWPADGNNTFSNKGGNGGKFQINVSKANITGVFVGNTRLKSSQYTIQDLGNGYAYITLRQSYLNTLKAGSYTLTVSTDYYGTTWTTFYITGWMSSKTFDPGVGIYVAMFAASAASSAAWVIRKKKED